MKRKNFALRAVTGIFKPLWECKDLQPSVSNFVLESLSTGTFVELSYLDNDNWML